MKKIGIDARLYSQTGVGTYLRNLLREISLLETNDMHFYVYVLPGDRQKVQLDPKSFTVREADCPWHSLEEQTKFLGIALKDRLDLFHFTYFGYPVLYRGRFVATVHDLTPLLFRTGKASTRNPLFYSLKHMVFRKILDAQVSGAVSVITPTATVKNQLVARYGNRIASKIHPVYEGVGYELREGKENTSLSSSFRDPFFLYVGNFYPHKNVERLVASFAASRVAQKLVLVGPEDHFSKSVARLIEKLGIGSRVTFFHNAKVGDLIYFYRHADALVHPSLSEGFGLPLIEAAHFGLPVIASDIPVIRELLDGSYLPFDPLSVEDMTAKLEGFSSHPKKAAYPGFDGKYSFRKMAESTVNIYKKSLSR